MDQRAHACALAPALASGNVSLAALLLDAGGEVDAAADGWNALDFAAYGKVLDAPGLRDVYFTGLDFSNDFRKYVAKHGLAYVLDFDSDVPWAQWNDGRGKQTLLMWAAESGQLPVVEHLIQAHADVNEQARYGSTALHRAAECGHAKVVAALLAAHADTAKTNSEHETALQKASTPECKEMLKAARKKKGAH